MPSIPVHEPLPANLALSPAWLHTMSQLPGTSSPPIHAQVYDAVSFKLLPAWLAYLGVQGGAPVQAPIVDKDKKVTLVWLSYMRSLP